MNPNDNDWTTTDRTHYGLPVLEHDGIEYAWAKSTNAANRAARRCCLESLWAFRSEFLSAYIPALRNDAARKAFDAMREKLCEDANDLVRGMLGDQLDDMLEAAIAADGRGHFLAGYDGHEERADVGAGYLYRI